MPKVLFSIGLLLLTLLSCKSQNSTGVNSENTAKMELILEENYSESDEEQLVVIKNQKGLEEFFGKVNRTRKPGIPIPQIDFGKDMLLVWCGGEKVSFPTELQFQDTPNGILVQRNIITKKVLEQNAIVNPFKIYKMPITSKSINFQ